MDPQIGQLVSNKYRLLRLIGDGGMGSVYEARHELLGTTVALKFLHSMLARRKGLVDRFLQEAQVSARIKSPHVVTVSDVDRTPEGMAYMVMEYVEGDTLQTLYEKNYHAGVKLSYGDAFEYILQMIDGVAAAHSLSIVHRDLKPDNVMLSSDGAGNTLVKILDFGIAKLKASGEVDRGLTRPGVVMGTPEYMAPEQAFSADRVDARADIFSLGVMFFEMLAGRRPVGGDNAHAIAAQYLEGTIAKLTDLAPNVDPELADAVHKAMAAKPAERFASIGAFRDAIESFAPSGAPRYKSAKLKAVSEASVVAAAAANDDKAGSGDRTSEIPDTVPPEHAAASGEAAADKTPTTPEGPADDEADAMRAGTEKMPDGAVAAIQARVAHAAAAPSGENSRGGTTEMEAVGEPHTSEQPPLVAAGAGPGVTHVPDGALASAMTPTAEATPAPAIAPHAHVPVVAPAARPRKKGGPSLLSIMLLASIISGAVVGGVYLAHRYGQEEDIADDTPPIPTQPVVPPTPTQTTPPQPPPPNFGDTPPPPLPPTPAPQPKAQPKPQPKPQPQPSTKPSAQPAPKPPPFGIPTVLPSTFPPLFPLPGRTQPPPTTPPAQPQPQPTTPPAQPQPTKPPRIIFRPLPQPKASIPPAKPAPAAKPTTPRMIPRATNRIPRFIPRPR